MSYELTLREKNVYYENILTKLHIMKIAFGTPTRATYIMNVIIIYDDSTNLNLRLHYSLTNCVSPSHSMRRKSL